MENAQVLERIGLNDKEAKIYLALLELGIGSVQSISIKSGIKRPTAYLILDDLEKKGLVSIVPQAKKSLYTAESPEYLVTDLARKQDLVKSSLPSLLAIFNAKKEKPQVQLFQGAEGVRQIYHKIFNSNEVSFFGTTKEVFKIAPELITEFIDRIKKQNLHVRDLLTKSREDLGYARQVERGVNYHIKFLPEDLDFPTDSALFGHNVVFFSFQPQVFAVMITSREISISLKTLYELAWQSAEPLQKSKS